MSGFDELIAGAKSGDREAAGALYSAYAPVVARRVRGRLGAALRRHYETEDVADSVFSEVLRELPRFEDRGEAAFVRWLCLKAENKVRDKYRRVLGAGGRRRQTTLDTRDAALLAARDDAPDAAGETSDETRRLDDLLAGLEPLDAEVVRLHGREQLPFAVVAERAGLPSAEAARKRYARALLALRARAP
jgi:RNA polymerase sigma factor (sigma-70 family)